MYFELPIPIGAILTLSNASIQVPYIGMIITQYVNKTVMYMYI